MSLEGLLRQSDLQPLEARVLAAHALGVDRAWIAAHGAEELNTASCSRLKALLGRRQRGEPVAYIIGEREFRGLSLRVTPDVLIPRPETELLVEAALERLPAAGRLIDLGTGSGAVAIAIAVANPRAQVAAADVSAAALAVARANASRHGASVRFEKSDWFAAFEGERFDMVVSNPPYIASSDPHLGEGDLRFEPRGALEAGQSGLECIERIAREAIAHLVPGGWLMLEHGHDQGEACVAALGALGYLEVGDRVDLAGRARVVAGRRSMAD